MNNYLLEIGVEEFPARFMESTKIQLVNNVSKLLEEEGIGFEEYRIEATPRRIALWLKDIQPLDKNTEEIVRGPSKKIALDDQGQATKALQGFMRSKGLEEKDIYFELQGDEEYVFAKVALEEIPLPASLQKIIPKAIRQISNPRSMTWGGKDLHFLRPIRWFLSLYNNEILDFDLEKIPVSNKTNGHRFLGEKNISVESIDSYEEVLEENYVIIDEEKREDMILRGVNRLAREQGGVPYYDDALLYEVVHIVEYPTPFLGEIPVEYLELPSEVIITSMKDHQRYFPVLKQGENKLLPYFISVRNGNEEGIKNVIDGNEKVLVPRLEDAKFFYEQDLNTPLEDFMEKLEGLTFHAELGSMKQKQDRLVELCKSLGEIMFCGEETVDHAVRAAQLSKVDLVTNMVIEFTELQGTMGRIYAEKDGESSIISQAIEKQYLPRFSGDALPASTAGVVLSLADKIDTIAGLFAIDTEVSGSQDPFGLRRAAISIIEILLDNKLRISLDYILREALVLYVEQQSLVFDYDEIITRIRDFFLSRLKVKMKEEGIRYDVVDAVLATEGSDIVEFIMKSEAVQELTEVDPEDELLTSFVRVENMALKTENTEVDEDFLEEDDRALYQSLDRIETIKDELNQGHYKEALQALQDWMPMINDYMDSTMIMVDQEEIKQNRLAMLRQVYNGIREILIPSYIVRD